MIYLKQNAINFYDSQVKEQTPMRCLYIGQREFASNIMIYKLIKNILSIIMLIMKMLKYLKFLILKFQVR